MSKKNVQYFISLLLLLTLLSCGGQKSLSVNSGAMSGEQENLWMSFCFEDGDYYRYFLQRTQSGIIHTYVYYDSEEDCLDEKKPHYDGSDSFLFTGQGSQSGWELLQLATWDPRDIDYFVFKSEEDKLFVLNWWNYRDGDGIDLSDVQAEDILEYRKVSSYPNFKYEETEEPGGEEGGEEGGAEGGGGGGGPVE